jgi:hypothetical protein
VILGTTMAVRMPKITITTKSSMRVKAFLMPKIKKPRRRAGRCNL